MNQKIEMVVTQGNNKVVLDQTAITTMFHQLYYNSRVWERTRYFGYPVLKCPLDLWIYQEMIIELKPDVIIETGTFFGASALYMAFVCDIIRNGEIITIDITSREPKPVHPRIKYLLGSSVAAEIVEEVREMIKENQKVMVILDSDHSYKHVLDELRVYAPLVTPGSYLIVEDTDVNGHPIQPDFGPGPMEAVEEFLKENQNFTIDPEREKFFMTLSPRGYLKKNS